MLAANSSPAALHAAIIAAARAKQSVHYVSASNDGTSQITIKADAGRSEGIQQVAFRKGGKTGHATVIVAGKTAYLRGDSFTLVSFIGLPSPGAAKYANVWIRIPSTSSAYAPIAAAVTLGSALDEIGPQNKTTAIRTTVDGQKLIGVRGTYTRQKKVYTDTIFARAANPPLPTEETVVGPKFQAVNAFSKWNEKISISIPKKTVAIANVLAVKTGPSA